ncbi:tRNA (guanosine(37)-N1)-methyltransferase TrmD [Clostridiaceae bacterium HSG29]|nr:tRNA (guanosine(37)-N1)-methyltransferase TrmD [Clostridiaceae bacterium HSG29]
MNFKVLTLFPEMFDNFLKASVIGKAIENKLINVELINIRDFSKNKHKSVDDTSYGGGPGMVMTPQPLKDAIEFSKKNNSKIIFLSPKGEKLTQKKANSLVLEENLILLCGHYEGIDQRIIDKYVDEEISIGDYVLTGGELGAMVLIDSIGRLVKGVIGDENSFKEDSHYNGLLDYPHYTKPQVFDEMKVPDVLISGNHKKINEWRENQSILQTYRKRPDMIEAILDDLSVDNKLAEKVKNVIKKNL